MNERLQELDCENMGLRKDLETLRADLAKANATLDVMLDGVLTIDESGTIETVNPAVERMFGYKPHEILGENVKCLMPEPYRGEHDEYLDRYRRTGHRRIIGIGREVQGLRRDGTSFPMELSVAEGFDGTRRFFAGSIRDLSERNDARTAQAGLAAILEDSLNEIFVFDAASLHFITVNRGARENLGFSMEQLHRLTPVDIKPGLSPAEFDALIQPLRAGTKERLHFETTHQRKDGSLYPVDVNLQLGTYEGKPAFVALIFDLTERKKAIQDLARVEKRAKDAEQLASIATLVAGIAHDVGTPMTVIQGYADLIQRSVEDEKNKERAKTIAEQTERVTHLIDTLLNISRPHEMQRVPVALQQPLQHALDFYREKLRKRRVAVERRFNAVPQVSADVDRLEQVFLNLIVNAAHAMADGGKLVVELDSPAPDQVEIRVRDTGTGIAADDLERIFEPFYTTKERGKGNGLGLLVSRGIIVDHGGSIEVTSTLGEGTEFRITLPALSVGGEADGVAPDGHARVSR